LCGISKRNGKIAAKVGNTFIRVRKSLAKKLQRRKIFDAIYQLQTID
jgi:hypothetical protein